MLLAAIVLAALVSLLAVRSQRTETNFVDTDAEWTLFLSASPIPGHANLDPDLCRDLALVGEGKHPDSVFRARVLPSAPIAKRLAVSEFCPQ